MRKFMVCGEVTVSVGVTVYANSAEDALAKAPKEWPGLGGYVGGYIGPSDRERAFIEADGEPTFTGAEEAYD